MEEFGDFLVGVALDRLEVEDGAIAVGQVADELQELVGAQAGEGESRYGGVFMMIFFYFGKTNLFVLKDPERSVYGNAFEPAFERALEFKLVDIGKDADKGLLEHVLRLLPVGGIASANRQHGTRVALKKRALAPGILSDTAFDQFFFGQIRVFLRWRYKICG